MSVKFRAKLKKKVTNDSYFRHIRSITGNKIIVDTNLLLLLLIGLADVNYIKRFSRTKMFTKKDYYLLLSIIEVYYTKIITTPNILTEVIYFLESINDPNLKIRAISAFLGWKLEGIIEEKYIESEIVLSDDCISYLGFVDASIASIIEISKEEFGVISKDEQLCKELNKRSFPTIDFTRYIGRDYV